MKNQNFEPETTSEAQAAGKNLPEAISSELKRAIPEIQAYRSAAELTIPLRALKIEGVDDREGYGAVDEARKNVRAERLELQRIGKATVDYLEAAKKLVRNQALEIVATYKETEEVLKEKLQAIDDEKTRIKEAEIRAALERFNNRVEQLFAAGFKYDGLNYLAGSMAVSPQDIEHLDDEMFSALIDGGREIVAELERLEADRQAELARFREMERNQKEQQEKLEREAARQEAEFARLKEEQERLARAQNRPELTKEEHAKILHETSVQAQAETDRAIKEEIDKRAAFQAHQERTKQELEAKGRADAAAPSVPLVPPARGIEELPAGYVAGFNACKNLLLEAFGSSEKRSRAQWVEFIRDLETPTC